MSLKPDYGLRLMRDGVSPETDMFFYDARLFSLSVLGPGQYSTTVELPHDGELHALSLDFSQTQLDQILAKASRQLAGFVRTQLVRDPSSPRTIDLGEGVAFGVRARLGRLQKAQRESFVPLVAREIM